MNRLLFAMLIGAGGLAILLYLGTWQVQRLAWKQGLLADIEARIVEAPIPLPAQPDPETDRYQPVTMTGTFRPDTARMLASRRHTGAVYRHIAAFDTEQSGAVLVDVGWTPVDIDLPPLPSGVMTLTGNLDWPIEADSFTPEPDLAQSLWYARDVPALAEALGTTPVLVVLRDASNPPIGATPWPVDTAGIPNDHLQYAITWFSLAVIWTGMTALFAFRNRRNT